MNNRNPYHILITCRDPATALSFNLILAQLVKMPELIITVVMQSPADNLINQIIGKAKMTFHVVKNNNAHALFSSIHQESPIDRILVGVSGPDTGVDEVALIFSNNHHIESYALQSFWGDFNQHCPTIPNTVFTLDSYATELNKKRFPEIRNIEVGSLKHADFQYIDVQSLRKNTREKILSEENITIIGFYGQPLQEISGYIETIKAFSDALKGWNKPFQLIYRAHPKESHKLKKETLTIFKQAVGSALLEDHEKDINCSLSACDLVISAFSTCCIDAIYLNLASKKAINSSVFLWFEPSLIKWWQDYSKMKIMPLTKKDQAIFSINNKSKIIDTLEQAIQEKEQAKQRAINSMPKASEAVNTIIHTITSINNNKAHNG